MAKYRLNLFPRHDDRNTLWLPGTDYFTEVADFSTQYMAIKE